MNDKQSIRKTMVRKQIAARGVNDPLVLKAMETVRREAFVPDRYAHLAYDDQPLPIGAGQTISQPFIVAFMIEALALKGDEKVLEIGAGSGYAAAVLGEIAREVYAIERIGELAEGAISALADQGCANVHVLHGDGTLGWEGQAPFDAILVSAGAPDVPASLKSQLAIGGRFVVPVGRSHSVQKLIRITRLEEDRFEEELLTDVRFVPLIGEEGWDR